MKKSYSAIICMLLFIAAVSCAARSKIVFNETIHDFGTVKQNTTLTYEFIFMNAGKSKLVIDRIKAG
jgi:hypothetical protein